MGLYRQGRREGGGEKRDGAMLTEKRENFGGYTPRETYIYFVYKYIKNNIGLYRYCKAGIVFKCTDILVCVYVVGVSLENRVMK